MDDATDGRARLTIEPMPPNERGPRIAVHGDRYYFLLGKDDFRSDTLFVMRMKVARNPRQQVTHYPGAFQLWPGGNPEELDPVAVLFGGEQSESESDEESPPVTPEPSPLLLRAMATAPASLVGLFRPPVEAAPLRDATQTLQDFRRFWRRYRLSGRLELPPRQESVLQGAVTPRQMDSAEWRLLSGQFGFGALNAVALDQLPADRFQQVLRDLSSLPLDSQGRAALWTGLLRGLSADCLRRELSQVALSVLQMAPEESVEMIAEGVLFALREVSARDRDLDLQAVAVAAAAAEAPLAHVAKWAKSLDFAELATDEESGPAASESVATVSPEAPGVTRWIARVSLPDAGELRRLVADAAHVIAATQSQVAEEALPELVAGIESLQALRDSLDRGVTRLPAPTEISEIGRQARAAVAEVVSLLGEDLTEKFLDDCGLAPDELVTVVKLLRQREDLARAPKWLVWPDEDPPLDLASATTLDLALLLADTERRHRWQKFLDCLRDIGEPAAVDWLRPPADGASVEAALDDWFHGARTFLADLTPDERTAVLGGSLIGPATLQGIEGSVDYLVDQLSTEAGQWLRETTRQQDAPTRSRLVTAMSSQVDEFCRSTGLGATLVTVKMLETWAAQSKGAEAPREPTMRVRHDWVGLHGARPTLTLVQNDPQTDLAYFDAPLALESEEPRAWTLRMIWNTKGDWRGSWPSDYPSIEPEELTVAKYHWRRNEEGGPYHYAFRLRIPVRVSRDPRKRLEVVVAVNDAKADRLLLEGLVLRWESLHFDSTKPINIVWSTVGSDEDVKQHPIGPQSRASEILDRLEALGCAAVTAPRRFGKTTLVNYLASALPSRGIYAPAPVVCTEHRLSQGIDYGTLWRQASKSLCAAFNTDLPDGWAGPLPPEGAFDAVRRAARKSGHKAIVLLFDEAQLFFPSSGQGPEIGSRLKARLEGAWCVPAEDMVPLLFCFVGLPPLVQRVGADLTGLLLPIEARDMTEEELRPLVDKKVPSLRTTRGLRAELARTSGNLYILRVLLTRLAARVNRERRMWASVEDLAIVSRDLAQDLREGREESLAAYIRDVLNESDDVNSWLPMGCVPVASAIAHVRSAEISLSLEELMNRSAERLNEWSRSSFADGRGQPFYDEGTVRRHFERLAELKVVSNRGHFESPYLEAWLSGLARRRRADDAFGGALFSGAQRRIRLSSGAKVVRDAGTTRILKAEDPHGALAFRVRRFEDDEALDLFRRNLSTFDRLRGVANGGEDGSAFILRLEDVGLSMTDRREAIQVYRWVDGEDLGSRLGCLAPEHVVDIGIKLGRALTLLHRRGILHGDIQPGNVIIDEGEHASDDLRPVLIDFDFAGVVGSGVPARVEREFTAPEVCAEQGEFSRACDVFSLGATLRSVLHGGSTDGAEVERVLGRALARSAAARPSAETFAKELQELAERLDVQERRDSAWAKVRSRLGQGVYVPELSATVNRHRTALELLELGSYGAIEERHRVIADIINQFVERARRHGLGPVAASTRSRAVEVLHALRVLHAHPETVLQSDHKRALTEYRRSAENVRSDVVREGIGAVSRHLEIPVLSKLLEAYA